MFNYGKAKVRWEWRVGGTEKSEQKVLGNTKFKERESIIICVILLLMKYELILDCFILS